MPRGGLPEERVTCLGLYLTAVEAYERWLADPNGVTLLDVRTSEEWIFTGHAPMAINVPVMFQAYVWDDEHDGFAWELNPEFADRVRERIPPSATILVACRAGGRGAVAVNMLAASGWSNVFNVLDGMHGDPAPDGKRGEHEGRASGWKPAGLPWTYELDPNRMAVPNRPTGVLHPGNAFD